MVDGMVRGSWKLTAGKAARLEVAWFEPLGRRAEAALRREGRALLEALLPGRSAEIVVGPFEG
jgi:hypothetical protein